ncbi:murein biosynthesis integral membrane protein MurJ [Priestia koreensis]|uniref:murein biosynthesis integral membrane protein MurJ n=1 Tax=Priestia koreensis TaxID=284581 RepID=UPI001F5AD56E|nr:murein biosynthesis integral membrane protein MurJ [Priestia koreensis]MCM3005566.1 murein biosynthesis integral membrane protein MurJ [Priestia koreensis]UNL86774.1 murein biosynthesis integral membrane protein MurJ [Priestia koreensis]
MKKFKATAIWSILLALVLKVSGLARESIVAKEFGASADTTAYYLAFSFITLATAMFSTGFNNVFLPMYVQRRKQGEDVSDRNANSLLNITIVIFGVISVLGWLYAKWFVPIIFPGMSKTVEPVAVHVTQIFFIFMIPIVLSVLLDSYLQSRRIFVPSQSSKLIATFMAIVFAILFSHTWGIDAVAYGFVIGTLIGVVIQFLYLVKSDYKWKLEFNMDKEFKKAFVLLLIPSLLNSAVGQVNFLVNKSFAAGTFDAAVTYLNNASMIVSIPTAIYSTTIVAMIFTLMSEQTQDKKAFGDTFYRGMEMSTVALLPISIGLILAGDSVISFIYERGKFTAENTHGTYMALIWYTPTIFFQGMQLILSKSMYAKGKTSTVFRISVTTIVLNLVLNWLLVDRFGYLALAFAASAVSVYFFVVSMIVVYKDLGKDEFKRFMRMMPKVLIPGAIMGLAVAAVKYLLPIGNLYSLIQLCILGLVGVIVYAVALKLINPTAFHRLVGLSKRRKK